MIGFLAVSVVLLMNPLPETPKVETQVKSNPKPRLKFDIQVKSLDKMQVLSIEKQGNFSEIGNVIAMVFKYAGEKGFQPAGAPMGIYPDDPKKVPPEKCRYEICVPIAPIADSLIKTDSSGIKIKELPEMQVAFLMHKGPYSKVAPTWGALYKWIFDNDYNVDGAGREVYFNSPDKVPEDSLITEIQIPVKK